LNLLIGEKTREKWERPYNRDQLRYNSKWESNKPHWTGIS